MLFTGQELQFIMAGSCKGTDHLQLKCVYSLCRHHPDLRKTLTAISQDNEKIAARMKGRNIHTKFSPLTSQFTTIFLQSDVRGLPRK
jgi:hypothetical protein